MSIQKLSKNVVASLTIGVGLLASAQAFADRDCSALGTRLQTIQRIADSLRPDKPGLARVFAYDGTEYTAGQALWMKGQLREVAAACARGDPSEAFLRLDAVQQLIQAHQNL
jgi:hypothetical protein